MDRVLDQVGPAFFVIISPPRSRSTYLCSLLDSHPLVRCHREIFHYFKLLYSPTFKATDDLLTSIPWRNYHPQKFIQYLFYKTQEQFPEKKVMGCKLLLFEDQMQTGLLPLLNFRPHVIYLSRENKMAWYSSLKISYQTNVWRTDQPLTQQYQIKFDQTEYLHYVTHQAAREKIALAKLQEFGVPYIQAEYHTVSEVKTINKILTFLKLPKMEMQSELVRQNTPSILDRFINADEVRGFLSSIGKEEWLGVRGE